MGVQIKGVGHYVPDRVVTNQELSSWMDTSDEWIRERSGIRERRFVAPHQSTSDLGYEAAKAALQDAGVGAKDIDYIMFATLSPDHIFPGCGVFLQKKLLGCSGIPALDIRTQCSGFIYGLSLARSLIETEAYHRILLVGAEIHSKGLDFSDAGRDVSVLFGDGAGAVVLEKGDEKTGIVDVELGADGQYAEDLWTAAPGFAYEKWGLTEEMRQKRLHFPQMNGRRVFQFATTTMEALARKMLKKHMLQAADISCVICHQANLRIIEYVRNALGWPEDKFFVNIQRYGNTTAASIPIALSEAKKEGRIRPGSHVLLLAFGSGFTWGSVLVAF